MITLRASLKTQNCLSLLVGKTPDSFGEKGWDEANKKAVLRDAFQQISYFFWKIRVQCSSDIPVLPFLPECSGGHSKSSFAQR